MSAAGVLARGRAAAERNMVDACVITRRTGESTDPNSGVVTPTLITVYTGRCRIQAGDPHAEPTDAGEAEVLLAQRVLQLPVATSTGIEAGDRVTITASVNDPDLVNRQYVVRGEFAKTHATARRLGIQEVTG